MTMRRWGLTVIGLSLLVGTTQTYAQDTTRATRGQTPATTANDTSTDRDEKQWFSFAEGQYREISDFFNVREANTSVDQGEWELELFTGWSTRKHTKDDITVGASLEYGVTDDFSVALELADITLGQGGDHGAGDLNLILFQRLLHEKDWMPAVAGWAEMRIPTGEGSSGVDGTFHLNATKTITPRFRTHLEGWVETANGGRGDEGDNRRAFQWGVGPGVDYLLDDKTIGVLNYINCSSEEYGNHNQNILELGVVRALTDKQYLKAAVDVGLDGAEETPQFAVKLMWTIDW